MTKIFFENSWQDYDYSLLYQTKGITDTPSTNIIAYDENMELLEAWYNSGYIWVEKYTQWYPVEGTPYYVKQNTSKILYFIDQLQEYDLYIKSNIEYIIKNAFFIEPSVLHDTEGYSYTPSEIYGVEQGVIWSWYNPEEELYWDDREGYKLWTPDPPVIPRDFHDWGIFTENSENSYISPHGTIDMSYLELVYGGGEQQYMIENPEVKGYLRSSAYQSSNRNLSANTEYYLYASGSDATVDGDSQHTYILKGAFTAAGVSVSISGASLIVTSSKLKLVWGPTGASVCYITYT